MKGLLFILGFCLLILIFIILTVIFFLRKSLPLIKGSIICNKLKANVTIKRDKQGIPTILGENRIDVAQATGFLHAQERFFQMDLLRRSTAGELSELFGEATIEIDKASRFHNFRAIAKEVIKDFNSDEIALLDAYVTGVNQGLNALKIRPFEYLLLAEKPKPWSIEDSVLSSIQLFFALQDSRGEMDLARGYMKKLLPESVYQFFMNNGSTWESTLDESKKPILPIPHESAFTYLKNYTKYIYLPNQPIQTYPIGGSNNWAIAGTRTANGKALVACDMHLHLSIPNIWYRAAFHYPNENGEEVKINGATIPGMPLMNIGSNRHIAWGFTNAYIDTTDLTIIKFDPHNNNRYMTPSGFLPFEYKKEVIKVKKMPSVIYEIQSTIWGPVLEDKFFGHSLALNWIAHNPKALNMKIIELETITSTEAALEASKHIKIPILNFIVGDSNGHIGWSLMGSIPKREGFDGTIPVSFEDGTKKWDGILDTASYPKIFDPPSGILWTANNCTLKSSWSNFLGLQDSVSGIRAYQIHKRLNDINSANPKDMLAIQLDTESLFFERWLQLLLNLLNNASQTKERIELKAALESWDKHCSVDSKGYIWLRLFRSLTMQGVLGRFLFPCFQNLNQFSFDYFDFEEPVWILVSQKPANLKHPYYESWDDELITYVDAMLKNNSQKIKTETWGMHSILDMNHPLSQEIPLFGRLLNMPKQALPGDFYVPCFFRESNGSSQRMAVSPGADEEGIFHAPGGQSGNPISPYYRDGHQAWVQGLPTPFLPSSTVTTLVLKPQLFKS